MVNIFMVNLVEKLANFTNFHHVLLPGETIKFKAKDLAKYRFNILQAE